MLIIRLAAKGQELALQHVRNTIATWTAQIAKDPPKNAESYKTNLKGIEQDISGLSKFHVLVEVIDDATKATLLLAKASRTASEIDLSEIVKHWNGGPGPTPALMSWASHHRPKVTLTAAEPPLVSLYIGYGFVCVDANERRYLRYDQLENYRVIIEGAAPSRGAIIQEMKQDIAKETGKTFQTENDLHDWVLKAIAVEKKIQCNIPMTLTDAGRAKLQARSRREIDWKDG
jgi:hypothetical protein